MKQTVLTVSENVALTENIYKSVLSGDVSDIKKPGQFINIKFDGLYLRRPISVCDVYENNVVIIYKVVGVGTEKLSKMTVGEKLDVLVGLGNGYDVSNSGDFPLLIGGGVGIPPLYMLAKTLIKNGKNVSVILGFNTEKDVFYVEQFKNIGAKVTVATVDGTFENKGFVTDYLPENYTYFFTCGPEPMLKAVYKSTKTSGQFSFEERMGCGFGACMGCSCKTITGYKRICKDGPVLRKEEILWED